MVTATDFLERRAVNLRTGGRYTLASRYNAQGNRREFACRTVRISPFQMLIAAPVTGPVGERVISFFGEFGKLDGWITDVIEGGFLIDIAATKKKREALAGKLSWLEKREKDPSVTDGRNQKRLVPENPHSTVLLADGTALGCFVIDMSPSGVAVSADFDPEIGTRLAVGYGVGHVVRRFAEGFAVQFDALQDLSRLEQIISPTGGFVERALAGPGIVPRQHDVGRQAALVRAGQSPAVSDEKDVWLV